MSTRKGRDLARVLRPSWGVESAPTMASAEHHCSRICRAAATYARLQETACNRPLTPREESQKMMARVAITNACNALPLVQGRSIRPYFGGDPRGATVSLVMPDGRYDSWGGPERGLCVPGS